MLFNNQDLALIQEVIAEGGKVWENEKLAPIKRKIKEHYRTEGNEQCCYCRRDMTDEFNMVIDIEHILPKIHFDELMFELFNLNISCKRCNMRIKKDRIDFLVDHTTIRNNLRQADQYKFIHPNIDLYFDNIDYLMIVNNSKKMIKYLSKTDKGKYTYDYFELEKIEVNSLNIAQGINTDGVELSKSLPIELIEEANNLLNKL
ncbi:hypothetical protein [Mucilaginibacter terrae]|uniref:Uncharacterized protein (TIGR02646 family) n=1 Tax=Mucilaginibacter terrae TaxID=1955052 RepID=A0ABU3GN98_9SPHI|nr:hypothetical protein [Mucilaginibacter terrae]MDT3401217.1 uncharacterized protein (TIGR02646 family) [Mucilaginibacter terrae]